MIAIALLMLTLISTDPPERLMARTPNAREILGAPAGSTLSGEALERKTKQVSSLLRCPVCQGLSVADSPSAMALNMKRQVRELLSWGYSQEQVLTYFERSYGQFVRLQPPPRGINWLVWLGPVLVLFGGAGLIAYALRRRRSLPAVEPPPAGSDGESDPYLERVRELAYGKPPEHRP